MKKFTKLMMIFCILGMTAPTMAERYSESEPVILDIEYGETIEYSRCEDEYCESQAVVPAAKKPRRKIGFFAKWNAKRKKRKAKRKARAERNKIKRARLRAEKIRLREEREALRAERIADRNEEIRKAAKSTKKKTGRVLRKAAVGTKKLAKKTAVGTKKLARKTAVGTKKLARKTAAGTKKLARKTAAGTRRGWRKVVNFSRWAKTKTRDAFDNIPPNEAGRIQNSRPSYDNGK